MFRNPFSVEGRIRRTEYGLSYIIYFIGIFIIALANDEDDPSIVLVMIVPLIWFLLAQRIKRCHDQGNSGWFQLIPFYGLWMLFADGDHGDNYYGPDPKGRMTPVEDEDHYYKKPEADNIGHPQE